MAWHIPPVPQPQGALCAAGQGSPLSLLKPLEVAPTRHSRAPWHPQRRCGRRAAPLWLRRVLHRLRAAGLCAHVWDPLRHVWVQIQARAILVPADAGVQALHGGQHDQPGGALPHVRCGLFGPYPADQGQRVLLHGVKLWQR